MRALYLLLILSMLAIAGVCVSAYWKVHTHLSSPPKKAPKPPEETGAGTGGPPRP
jgi:hypothetical protein